MGKNDKKLNAQEEEMKKIIALFAVLFLLGTAVMSLATTKDAEALFRAELTKIIPQDKILTIDDLYKKWEELEAGKSKVIIIDIRTETEFDAGHIKNSNNIDSGHAYSFYKKVSDPNAEIWVFCRTDKRGAYFVSMLYNYGYKNVYFIKGGIKEWAEKGYPLVNKYLGEIKVIKYHNKLKEKYLYRENK